MRKIQDYKPNQTEFYYQEYLGYIEEYDDDGNLTGDTHISYSKPIKETAMISSNTSDVELTPFGKDAVYDKMISTVKKLPIDEHTRLFIDVTPKLDENGDTQTKPDYEVIRVAKGLYQNVWAIKKVEGYEQSNNG